MSGPIRSLFAGAVCSLAAAFAAAPAWAQNAPVVVVISGLRYGEGSVQVDVCTRASFLTPNCPYSASAPARVGAVRVTVRDVPPGVYAVQAFHDINGDRKPDRGPLGIPREGLAFSNDAPLGLTGPSFARAAFTHADAAQTLNLHLRRFRPPPAAAR